MILKENNLTVQECKKFYIELIVLFAHPKKAIMFDHRRLGLENKWTYSCIVFALAVAPFERLWMIDSPWWQPIYTLYSFV